MIYYERNDEIAVKEVDKYYFIMAVGIYNIQYTFDLEVIILGAAISERAEYIDEINKRLNYLMNSDLYYINSLRTSIQWTRLIKDFETGEVDEDGVIFYRC